MLFRQQLVVATLRLLDFAFVLFLSEDLLYAGRRLPFGNVKTNANRIDYLVGIVHGFVTTLVGVVQRTNFVYGGAAAGSTAVVMLIRETACEAVGSRLIIMVIVEHRSHFVLEFHQRNFLWSAVCRKWRDIGGRVLWVTFVT